MQKNFFFVLVSNEVRVDNVLVRKLETRFFVNLHPEMAVNLGPRSRLRSQLSTTQLSTTGATTEDEKQDEELQEVEEEVFLRHHAILREWSYCEASFDELKRRGDLDPNQPEQISKTLQMLKSESGDDLKARIATIFSSS